MIRVGFLRRWFYYRGMPLVQVLVCLAAMAAVGWLFRHRAESFTVSGLAQGRVAPVTAPFAARIHAVPARLFQTVKKGDVVAVLDDTFLRADLADAAANVATLRTEYADTQAAASADLARRLAQWEAENRACLNDVTQLAISLHETKALLEYDRGMVTGLAAAARSAEQMAQGGLAPTYDLLLAKAEYEATARRIAENERLLARLEGEHRAAEQRQQAHLRGRPGAPPDDAALTRLRGEALEGQESVVRQWEAQRDECVLRAPFDGMVVEVPGRAGEVELQRPGEGAIRGPGEFVLAGEPILAIAESRPTEVVAYATDRETARVRPGLEVELATTGQGSQRALAAVIAVSPTVQQLPQRLCVDPRVPQWGRAFLVGIPPKMALNVGDRVTVRKRGSAAPSAAPDPQE